MRDFRGGDRGNVRGVCGCVNISKIYAKGAAWAAAPVNVVGVVWRTGVHALASFRSALGVSCRFTPSTVQRTATMNVCALERTTRLTGFGFVVMNSQPLPATFST